MAAASPIAADESLRLALEHDVVVGELGELRLDRGAVRPAGDDHDALLARERREPFPGRAQQRLPDPVRSCRNFGASARDSGQSRDPMPPAGMTL